ncbi:MAG: O-antigen ligase [Bacteriovoracaceae bacterium]|jgi:O-antigen ligase
MEEVKLLTIELHQFFFCLTLLGFGACLFHDLGTISRNKTRKKMVEMALILSGITIGSFFYLLSFWGIEGVFMAISFAGLIGLSVYRPKYAVGLFVYILLSRPWETYDNQMMSSMPRDISYLVMLSLVGHKLLNRQFYFRFNFGTFFFILFALWMFLSAFFASHQADALSMYNEIFTKGVILFILIQNGIERASDILPTKIALVSAILEKSVISFFKTYLQDKGTLGDAQERLVSVGILENSNDIAAIFILAIPFTAYFILNSKLRPLNYIAAVIAVAGMGALIMGAQSRGAVLGLAGLIGTFFFTKLKSRKSIILVLLMTFLGGILVMGKLSRSSSDLEGSTGNRVIYWKAGINMGIRNPLFGVGFWGFHEHFSEYAIDGETGSEAGHREVHSAWLQVLSEGGVIAFALYLSLWGYGLYCGFMIRKKSPEYLISLVGYGITITFLSHAYLLYGPILLALTITQHHMLKQPEPKALPKRMPSFDRLLA